MIAKKDLVPYKYYVGTCRNAQVAQWDGAKFWYIRSKFGNLFAESINHPEDDNGFDLFIPVRQVPPLTEEEAAHCGQILRDL